MDTNLPKYRDRIVQDPQVMVGKPVVRGTRIPVERVIAHLRDTPDFDDLFAAFPHLTMEDVQACFAYAYDTLVDVRHQEKRAEALAGHSASR